MAKAKWVGVHLSRLYWWSLPKLYAQYPSYSQGGIKSKKSYWSKKINNGEIPMPEKPPEEVPERVAKSWDVSAFNRETNEWDTKRNYSYDHNPLVDAEMVIPRRLVPSKNKPPKRAHKEIVAFGDAQIGYRAANGQMVPLHDEAAMAAVVMFVRDRQPDVLVDGGDTTDFGELSKYPKDSTQIGGPTLQASLQRTYDFFADLSEAAPKSEKHAVDSNHVKRLGDFVLRNAYQLADLTRIGEKYPVWSYPGLLRMDEIGWEWHGGYGSAEYRYKNDLGFTHGVFAVSNGSTAAKLSKANYGRNMVQFHAHRMEMQYSTDREGNIYAAIVAGALCRRIGVVPSYHSSVDQHGAMVENYENWQNGILVVKDYGDGHYQFDQVPIVNGVIKYDGKEYNGNQEGK